MRHSFAVNTLLDAYRTDGDPASRVAALDTRRAMNHAADYRDVVVAYRNGAPIKLSEVAHVIERLRAAGVPALLERIPPHLHPAAVGRDGQRRDGGVVVGGATEGVDDARQLQQIVRRTTGKWVSDTYRRRPMIIPLVVEV